MFQDIMDELQFSHWFLTWISAVLRLHELTAYIEVYLYFAFDANITPNGIFIKKAMIFVK
jgi:hypothetical protein